MKRKNIFVTVWITALILVLLTGLAFAHEQAGSPITAAFTYQGHLNSSGSPYTGTCDFQFGLWDADTSGTQIGSTLTLTDVGVNNGLFTVSLDWGLDKFQGEARWLDIYVRCPAGSGTYTQLTPRQPLSATPFALFALSADPTVMQKRVIGTCATGSAIRVINLDGDVTCESTGSGGGAWLLTGNSGTTAGTNYLGTNDNMALVLKVNSIRALLIDPDSTSPNLIGGYFGNSINPGVYGAVISGGGKNASINMVTDAFGTVGGGASNRAGDDDEPFEDAAYATVGGGYINIASGLRATIGGGYWNTASGSESTVGGGQENYASGTASTASGGAVNLATGNYSFTGGGEHNTASGSHSTVNGGWYNSGSGIYATVAGGYENDASGEDATVSGGKQNVASYEDATVGGGFNNGASGYAAIIAGGAANAASNTYATIGGGGFNTAGGASSFIGGGVSNTASYTFTVIGGGYGNEAGGDESTVGGGRLNNATGLRSTIGGGAENTASGSRSTICGGQFNWAPGWFSTIVGGSGNTATSDFTYVGAGSSNDATDYWATICGGEFNTASADYAFVGGGTWNTASGYASMVPGGAGNHAQGQYSFAAGRKATAPYNGCFVWGDSNDTGVQCNNANEIVARSSGGVYFYTNSDLTSGSYLASGGTSWNVISDRTTKENFSLVDSQAILEMLSSLPVQEYNLKSQDDSIRHIGLVAQDFAAFGFGESEKAINLEDADGVAMAAIQALYAQLQEKDSQIDDLEARLARLEKALNADSSIQNSFSLNLPLLLIFGLITVGGNWVVRRRREGGR